MNSYGVLRAKDANTEPLEVKTFKTFKTLTWQKKYWDRISDFYFHGISYLGLGFLVLIIVLGVVFIIQGLLFLILATLMVISYPLWDGIDYVYSKRNAIYSKTYSGLWYMFNSG